VKLFVRLLAFCLTLLSATLLIGVYLLHSQSGLEWSYRLAATLLPGELSIEHLEGRLLGPLTLRGVNYHNDKTDIRMAQLDLQWQPGALVEGDLQIASLTIVGLHILRAPSPAAANTLPDVRLPIAVHIDRAIVRDFTLGEPGKDPSITLTEASLSNAAFEKDRLSLAQLAVIAPRYRIDVTGNLAPQRAYPMDIAVRWSADGGEYGAFAGRGQISGDLRQLKIQHQLTAPVPAELRGTIDNPLTKLGWQGELSWPAIDLHALHGPWPALTLAGAVRGSGTLNRMHTEGELHSGYQGMHADHRFAVDYDKGMVKIRRLTAALRESGANLTLHGTLTDLAKAPQAALEGEWQNLRWPLQGQALLLSKSGRFTLSGAVRHYQFHVAGDLAGERLPAGTWSVSGEGGPQQLTVTQADAHILNGKLAANGTLAWQTAPQWQFAVQAEDIDPGAQWPDWPGRLALTAQLSGAVMDSVPQLQIDLTHLQGELKSVPLDADGALAIHGDQFQLAKLRIDSGGNRFTASGSLQDEWNMEWQVAAADLARLLPGSGGRLQGSGYVTGPRKQPSLTASLSGEQLRFADNSIGQISLVMAVDTQGRVPSTVELEANDAALGSLSLESLRLHGDGTAQHHQARLVVSSPRGNAALSLSGRFQQQAWSGTLDHIDLDVPAAGRWRLAAPAAIAVDNGALRLDEFCLQQDSARLCASAMWAAADNWQVQSRARDLPLGIIQDWMPSATALAGSLDADAHVIAKPAGLITGMVDARFKAGVVPPAALNELTSAAPIAYHDGRLKATLDEHALTADLQVELADGGGVQGTLYIDRTGLPSPLGGGHTLLDTALKGQLQADVRDLSLLPALIAGVEHVQGHLSAALVIAGSWEHPRLGGELRLEDGAAAIPAFGLNPEGIDVVAHGDAQGRLRLDAQLRSGTGTLRLSGDVQLERAGWNIQAQLEGDRAEIANTPEFHILASPKIHLSVQGRRIDVDGEILIPEANLRPRDVSGAVSASDDVVIIGAEGLPAPETRWQIYSQLRVRLGDFVKFSGFGLKGLLAGDLTLSDEPQRPTVGRGELHIIDGEYRAYGQKLTVDRGRLLFFGGPLDNPGLDIRAVRQVQEVTAGILVRGTLRAPQVQLFSEPAMAEADALAYLLIGQPINQATTTQGQQLYGAALSLGLAGSGLLANQIGQRFGIDEVLVESGGSFGGGALVIRHYLSPKLYISYGVGIVERFNIFLMRYQISRRWALEAESGIQSGADMVYTLEKK